MNTNHYWVMVVRHGAYLPSWAWQRDWHQNKEQKQ